MLNRQLKQTIALLETRSNTVGLNPKERRELRIARLKLRFFWVPQALLHISFVVVVFLSYRHWSHLDHVKSIYEAADRLDISLTKAESSQRGYLLTGRQIYLTDYTFYTKLAHSRMDELCLLIPANESNDRLCRSLERDIMGKLEEMQSTVAAAKAGNYDRALQIVRTDRGLRLTGAISGHLGNIRLETQEGHISRHGSCLVQ